MTASMYGHILSLKVMWALNQFTMYWYIFNWNISLYHLKWLKSNEVYILDFTFLMFLLWTIWNNHQTCLHVFNYNIDEKEGVWHVAFDTSFPTEVEIVCYSQPLLQHMSMTHALAETIYSETWHLRPPKKTQNVVLYDRWSFITVNINI